MKRETIIKFYEEDLKSLTRKPRNFVIEMLLKQAKAFGDCFKCFGKGYGTETKFATSGVGDFEPAEPKTWKLETMIFCGCERGRQLAKLLGVQHNRAYINELH